jgi:uncharacterized protein with HEPN domain
VTRTTKERLADIKDAADGVQRAVEALELAESQQADDAAQLAFDALLYRLVVIGEAVKAMPAELLASQPQVPWREIARLRDLLAHHYYRVDVQVIRRTVEAPMEQLRDAVANLIAADGGPDAADAERQ